MATASGSKRTRVLLLTPTGRDSALIIGVLSRNGIQTYACSSAAELAAESRIGAAATLIAEEALTRESVATLVESFRAQPPWSDLPIILLSVAGESTPAMAQRVDLLAPLGNLTVIERPVRPATLLSIVKAAVRARQRQYDVAALLSELQVAEGRLRTMIEGARDYAIINLDLSGRVTYWNSGAERLLGYSEPAIVSKSIDLVFSDEDRRAGVPVREREIALETGRAETEGWRIRRDGSRFWASGVVSPTRDAAQRVTGFVKVLRDMTEQKHAKERLAEQAKALQQSNEDLQRFAYVASHDLQEPLRMVGIFSQLFAQKHEDKLDEDSQQFLKFIRNGVERMDTLIRDLLEFSRLTTEQARPVSPVDCNSVVELALENLQIQINEKNAKVVLGRLPVVLAHETRLLQVFQNLIGNGLKYSHGSPEVQIWAERDGSFWQIAIRDNGIGIAPEHHDRIFRLFDRLHARSDYPGTGIGLATCKRIIEQAGGRIWVDSATGRGSTFYFTLPAAEPIEAQDQRKLHAWGL